ncbi:MAG: dihydrofolate reductase [Oscillospiraceae bacterium]|nr:dihydrofolate reductase [Oscillospiraceae bacterium]
MNIIVAVDSNWGIGCDNKLLYNIPADMQHFKRLTDGKIVVMGKNTLLSLPNSKPLKNRINIVLSNSVTEIENAIVCNSIEQLLKTVKQYNSDDVFVIGGQIVYEELLDYCSYAYITKIHTALPADRFFPNIDNKANWELVNKSAVQAHGELEYTFCEYRNLSVK